MAQKLEKKLKQINKNAILIHQLQLEDKDAALSYFSKKSIEKVSYSSEGLQIFFKEYGPVIKSIRREKIEVGGLFYKIYPLVTNLTIRKIGPYANNSAIEDVMQDYGFIIDLYRIQETVEHEGCKTTYLTDDYRVILDVPEVFAPSLTPVTLPKETKCTFKVLFFCRLCRHNGHMQFQCSNVWKSSSSSISRENGVISRKLSYENDSTIHCDKVNRPQFDFCIDERKSEVKHISHIKKTQKEKKYFPHQKYSEDISHKHKSSKNCRDAAMYSKSMKGYNKMDSNLNNPKKERRDSFSSTSVHGSEKFRVNSSSFPQKPSNETSDGKRFHNRSFHQYSGSENSRVEASASKEYWKKQTSINDNKRKKKQATKLLAKVLPPNTDLQYTKKLIQIALKCGPEDISDEIQAVLLSILKYNHKRENKYADKHIMHFLSWINALLNKIKEKKISNVKLHKDSTRFTKKEQKYVRDEKSDTEISKQRSLLKRTITLSSGIKEAISLTCGELQPTFLCNFLNQVRGRKNKFEVAIAFTNNIPALATQLLEIQNTYFKYVQKRGPEENRDIRFIKRLRLRLLEQGKKATETFAEANISKVIKKEIDMTGVSIKKEVDMTEVVKTDVDMKEVSFKKEVDMTEVVKTETDMAEVIKTEVDMTEVVKTEIDMTGVSIKSETDKIEVLVKAESDGSTCINTSGLTEVPVKTEPATTEVQFVKTEQSDMTKISAKTEPVVTDTFVERNYDMAEISVKNEDDIFMRQSWSSLPNSLYGASYFTNITQMPFSLDFCS